LICGTLARDKLKIFAMVIEKLGRYIIVEELGQGAMGVVYKAVDPLIDRTVAIKTINLDLSRDELESFEKRFQREVQSAGKLNHPNIVTIYDVGRTEGVAYMAMEFLEGKELREILDSGVVLPVDKVVHIAAQICDGLAFAHDHSIIHRDVKPANIMVMKNGMVKITDFGIAQVSSASRTMAGMVMGSPKYMSPEQVVGQAVDGRSDIFSLGVVLYEMLTGKTPFVGDNISAIMYQILNEEPIPPKAFNQNIPDSINYIILRALAKHPDARYQTAKEMGRDLRKYKTLEIPAPGELAPPATAPMERRKTPRENLGDATQVISRLSDGNEAADSAREGGPARTGQRWPLPRLALLAAIPILLAAFVLLVITRNQPSEDSLVAPDPAPQATTEPAPQEAVPGANVQASGTVNEVADKPQEAPAAEPIAATQPKPKKPERPKPARAAATESALAESKVINDAPKPVLASGSAVIELAIAPWGEVFVDGVRQGVTPPLRELKLQPGKHTILIVNQTFTPYSQTIELQANTTHKIKYKFTK
jgi:serine/threonine-protein kinase